MELPFGLYPRLYVKRKAQLFPVIEKYTGEKIAPGTPHGKIIPVYFRLLRTDEAFRAEIDALIEAQESKLLTAQQKVSLMKAAKENKGAGVESNLHGLGYAHNSAAFNNAISDWRILNVFRSEENKVPVTNKLFGGTSEKTLSGSDSGSGSSATGIFGGIAGAVGSIFDYAATSKAAKAQEDAAFMEVVLNEQKKDDTMKILAITGVTVVILGLGVYFVLKLKKS